MRQQIEGDETPRVLLTQNTIPQTPQFFSQKINFIISPQREQSVLKNNIVEVAAKFVYATVNKKKSAE